ncbi:MAG: Rieske (2Fe-2S) protein [Candidatus Eiseniibacteriota bacterium]
MSRTVRIASPGEIAPGQSRLIEEGGVAIAVFNANGTHYAISNECPHRQGPLHEGYLEGLLVTCPWHGWQFELPTGRCETVPGRDLRTYPIVEQQDGLYLTLPD